jgi:hypothetical protein
MPQQLPYGMSVEGLGLRRSAPGMAFGGKMGALVSKSALFELAEESPIVVRRLRKSASMPAGASGTSAAPPPPRSPSPGIKAKKGFASSKGRASPFQSLAARLVLRTVDRLVVEFEVEEDGFDWSPDSIAVIRLADGRTVEVEVDLKTTTAAGELDEGTTVRLVLRLAQPLTGGQMPVGVELSDSLLELTFPPVSP